MQLQQHGVTAAQRVSSESGPSAELGERHRNISKDTYRSAVDEVMSDLGLGDLVLSGRHSYVVEACHKAIRLLD